ncbi:MAG: DNA mismatch repair endonuclease MutL [Chloroflexi bacterium]|nr:DNA mismatch repair endonuclease MutL [Chloroflexota bacterium]MCL5026427.1 DNA mismatch repair endonuclease MutL [Chloroflexota bacterium]
MPIRVLPPQEAGKIAAGEVVERPASVVKELVENALDAGATSISVEVREGGLSLIRVVDDGAGIPPSELPLAFQRHATSKIGSLDDLQRLSTLGFRGEALPSIAAVAEVTLVSRTAGDSSGAYVVLRRGQIVEEGTRGAPPGTAVAVRRLFAEVPARLKFLKSPRTELAHIHNMLGQLAMSRPGVRFRLLVDGRRGFESPGSGRLIDVLVAWHGGQTAARLLEVGGETGGLWGYVSPPELARATRADISLFVNGRWVQARSLAYAIEEAYQGLLPPGRHPLAALHLRVPPADLDVNIHPAKAEVRFRRERDIFALVQKGVRETLTGHLTVPSVVSGAAMPHLPTDGGDASRGFAAPAAPGLFPAAAMPAPGPAAVAQTAPATGARLPVMRVLGQMDATFIVAEGPDGIYLVDQHRAHERVLYERMAGGARRVDGDGEGHEGGLETQLLLEPLVLALSPRQTAFLPAAMATLAALGFDLEPFGEGTYLLRAAPALLPQDQLVAAVSTLVDELLESEVAGDLRERARRGLACRGAIKAGQALSPAEMRELLVQLESTASPLLCPHGDPIIVHLSKAQLERQFGRG